MCGLSDALSTERVRDQILPAICVSLTRMDVFAFHSSAEGLKKDGQTWRVTLQLPRELEVDTAWVRSEPDNEEFLSPLERQEVSGAWALYEGELRLNPAEEVTLYTFKFIVDGYQYWLAQDGVSTYFPERDVHFRINPTYEPASWVWSSVFYQIFPERFYDGDPGNNVTNGEYLYEGEPVVAKQWGELPDRSQGPREFYGGDLAGIRQKLPYLEDLGVTALYLNPIFASPSSHKYDTVDYLNVDPHFGTNEEFAELCSDLKERDMRIILDAVINHTSERHPWFDRYGEYEEVGAYGSKTAQTRDFYTFYDESDPESYHGWIGVKTLPTLDYSDAELRRRIYEADDAILRYWLKPPYEIDGWRFDVLHMLGEGSGAANNTEYVRHFRRTLREENPQAYVLGEHFYEATKWLQGDQEDAAMNYDGFARPLWAFFAEVDHKGHPVQIDAATLNKVMTRSRARLPFEIQLSQFNLLGSHDTPRFLTRVEGNKGLMKAAVTLLMTYIGVPCIYYGDEVGVEGGRDPDCRRTFPWDEAAWDQELRGHVQALIAFRKAHKVLQRGALVTLYAEGNVYAFARIFGDEVVVAAVNRGEEVEVTLPAWKLGLENTMLTSLFENQEVEIEEGRLELFLAKCSSLVLHKFG